MIWDQHPDFWPNLDPDLDTIFFKKTYFLKPLYKKIMSPEEIFSQLNMVNVPVRYVFNLSCYVSNLSHIYLSGSGFVFVMRFRIRNTDPIWIRIQFGSGSTTLSANTAGRPQILLLVTTRPRRLLLYVTDKEAIGTVPMTFLK